MFAIVSDEGLYAHVSKGPEFELVTDVDCATQYTYYFNAIEWMYRVKQHYHKVFHVVEV